MGWMEVETELLFGPEKRASMWSWRQIWRTIQEAWPTATHTVNKQEFSCWTNISSTTTPFFLRAANSTIQWWEKHLGKRNTLTIRSQTIFKGRRIAGRLASYLFIYMFSEKASWSETSSLVLFSVFRKHLWYPLTAFNLICPLSIYFLTLQFRQ